MKKKLNFWAAALAASMLLGCFGYEQPTDEEKPYGEIQNVTLDVKFRLQGVQHNTKAAINDQIIENVNLFIVDENGKVVHNGYYNSLVNEEIEVYDNMYYTLYAIANAGKEIQAQYQEEIESLTYSIKEISEIKSNIGAVLMRGKTEPQMLTSDQQVTIELTRCVAKIRLKADYSQLYEDVNIEVNSIQLKNAPKQTTIFTENKILEASGSIDGEIIYSPSATLLENGTDFYQFENMQGTLLPQNTSQQEKQWPQESIYNKLCSYIELNAAYSSPRKYGEILYRFYLGNDMLTNFDIKRNTQLNITVNFKNDGAVDENTWRVDNSEIIDLITGIELSPSSLQFTQLGESKQIDALIFPLTAHNQELEWSSTNATVATVDTEGKVTSIGNGECQILATSTDGTNITATCTISVNYNNIPDGPTPIDPPTNINVTSIKIYPEELTVLRGENYKLTAEVLPATATDKTLQWSSSNNSIAQVDNDGKVTAIAQGECLIYATSASTPEIKGSSKITVTEPALEYKPLFKQLTLNTYDGKISTIEFTQTATGEITATSSNNSVVKITETNGSGVTIEALTPGEATITAGTGGETTAQCTVKVEKLRIVPEKESYTMYNHFYEDIEYAIEPSWAATEFTVNFIPEVSALNCSYEGLANRVIPQFGADNTLPEKTKITLKLSGREDVYAEIGVTVKPMLTFASSMKINANMGNTDAVRSLGLETSPRGNVQFRWVAADGVKYYGEPGNGNVQIDAENNKITFPIPNSANGLYCLAASVTGDDGYGGESTRPDSELYCEITIYETIYLVGVSKTVDRNKVEGTTDTWEYENEIIGKWYSHPNSLIYSPGELDLDLSFTYNGVTYNDSHTGETEKFRFTFEKGEYLNMALGSQTTVYNGTPPPYYLEYFQLQPTGSTLIDGNPATGSPYLYIYSRPFASGFSNQANPDWEKIFELIYP